MQDLLVIPPCGRTCSIQADTDFFIPLNLNDLGLRITLVSFTLVISTLDNIMPAIMTRINDMHVDFHGQTITIPQGEFIILSDNPPDAPSFTFSKYF